MTPRPGRESVLIGVRLDPNIAQAVDQFHERLQQENPYMRPTRGDAMRILVGKGLEAVGIIIQGERRHADTDSQRRSAPAERRQMAIEFLADGAERTTDELASELGLSNRQARDLLRHMVDTGAAERVGRGVYRLAE